MTFIKYVRSHEPRPLVSFYSMSECVGVAVRDGEDFQQDASCSISGFNEIASHDTCSFLPQWSGLINIR